MFLASHPPAAYVTLHITFLEEAGKATIVCVLKLLVYHNLNYKCIRPQATSVPESVLQIGANRSLSQRSLSFAGEWAKNDAQAHV